MIKQIFILITCLFFLTGCWSNQELDDVAMVHGVGLDQADGMLNTSVEIIRPAGQGGEQSEGQESGQHLILTRQADTLLEGARELIRYAKRRLSFEHTRAWVIGTRLAEDEHFIQTLDTIRRDQMLRLNSYLFVTEEDPSEVLQTETLYENLMAIELVSGLDQISYISDYSPLRIRELYRLLEGPVPNAYLPMITIEDVGNQRITAIDGTAVINQNRMVGVMTSEESIGLNWLIDRVEGGDISVSLGEERVALEITDAKTNTIPIVRGNQVDAEIHVRIEGTYADNITDELVDEQLFESVEEAVANKIESDMRTTLDLLQNEFQTDITRIGIQTHRKHPEAFQEFKDRWNEVFSEASVDIQIDVTLTHEGLIKENINREKERPHNNPYQFFR